MRQSTQNVLKQGSLSKRAHGSKKTSNPHVRDDPEQGWKSHVGNFVGNRVGNRSKQMSFKRGVMLKFRGPSVLAAQQDYFLNDTGEEPEEGEQVQHSTSGVVSVAKKNQEDEYTERRMHESYTDVCGEMANNK